MAYGKKGEGLKGFFRLNARPIAIVSAILALGTILLKDSIADDMREQAQTIELTKQFYELHTQTIDLTRQLDEMGDSVEEIRRFLGAGRKDMSPALQDASNGVLAGQLEAAKNERLIRASSKDTLDLLERIDGSNSIFLLFYPENTVASEGILRSAKMVNDACDALRSDLQKSVHTWEEVYRRWAAGKATDEETVQAFQAAKHDADAAAIQSMNLKDSANGQRKQALEAAEIYLRHLEGLNRFCEWTIVLLLAITTVMGAASHASGAGETGGAS
jgi:hypothetical protein